MEVLLGKTGLPVLVGADTAESSTGRGRVRILACGDERQRLIEILNQLNYQVQDEPAAGTVVASEDPVSVFASIVSDAVASPFEACAALRSQGPIVMISSDTSFAFRLKAARAGAEALIRRPVNATELSEWLEHFANRDAFGPISVLIVDDDPLIAELHGVTLRAAGMKVGILSDPAAAIDAVEATLPDLVLMDVRMPGADGVELAQIIRQSWRFAAMPILFLSGERDEARQLAARQFGGDDFIIKPVDPNRLISLVRLRAERARVLRSLIERDSLTGLYDHGRFTDRLSHELERCRRFGGELSLAMIDVDQFKSINDTFGHPVGDTVIRTLASLLRGNLRKIDIIGRYGGEEFGVILLDTAPRAACGVIDKLRERFSRIVFEATGRSFSVTFSAGVACSRHHGNAMYLIAAADTALYLAKDAGRNIVVEADPAVPLREARHAGRNGAAYGRV